MEFVEEDAWCHVSRCVILSPGTVIDDPVFYSAMVTPGSSLFGTLYSNGWQCTRLRFDPPDPADGPVDELDDDDELEVLDRFRCDVSRGDDGAPVFRIVALREGGYEGYGGNRDQTLEVSGRSIVDVVTDIKVACSLPINFGGSGAEFFGLTLRESRRHILSAEHNQRAFDALQQSLVRFMKLHAEKRKEVSVVNVLEAKHPAVGLTDAATGSHRKRPYSDCADGVTGLNSNAAPAAQRARGGGSDVADDPETGQLPATGQLPETGQRPGTRELPRPVWAPHGRLVSFTPPAGRPQLTASVAPLWAPGGVTSEASPMVAEDVAQEAVSFLSGWPAEIWQDIVELLCQKGLAHLRATCTFFRDRIDTALQHDIVLPLQSHLLGSQMAYLSRLVALKTIEFVIEDDFELLPPKAVADMFLRCPKLRKVTINDDHGWALPSLAEAIVLAGGSGPLPLEELHVICDMATSEAVLTPLAIALHCYCPRLRQLSVQCGDGLWEQEPWSISRFLRLLGTMPHLRSLRMRNVACTSYALRTFLLSNPVDEIDVDLKDVAELIQLGALNCGRLRRIRVSADVTGGQFVIPLLEHNPVEAFTLATLQGLGSGAVELARALARCTGLQEVTVSEMSYGKRFVLDLGLHLFECRLLRGLAYELGSSQLSKIIPALEDISAGSGGSSALSTIRIPEVTRYRGELLCLPDVLVRLRASLPRLTFLKITFTVGDPEDISEFEALAAALAPLGFVVKPFTHQSSHVHLELA